MKCLVKPALALMRVPEVLDRVGAVGLLGVDPSLIECTIEQPSRWADERLALAVFLVSGLLAHEHQRRVRCACPKDGLGGVVVQLTAATFVDRCCKCGQGSTSRQIRLGAPGFDRRCLARHDGLVPRRSTTQTPGQ